MRIKLLIALAIFLSPAAVRAALAPGEVVVLANSSLAGSVELAQYYGKARGVAAEHILALPMPDGELVGREVYEKSIAVQVRQKLQQMPDGQEIRCILTVYGVPLRIGPATPSQREQLIISRLRDQTKPALDEAEALLEQAGKVASLEDLGPEAAKNESLENRLKRVGEAAGKELKQARDKVASWPESKFRQQKSEQLDEIEIKLWGLAGRISQLQRQGPITEGDPRAGQIAALEEQIRQAGAQMGQLIHPQATDQQLQQASELARQSQGVMGLILQLSVTAGLFENPYRDSSSSFDSELSMVLAGEYPRGGFVPNSLRLGESVAGGGRVLMVSRIDGPDERIARRLIDMAISAEKSGLKGRAYVDTGWGKAKNGGYKDTEDSLLATAGIFQQYSGMEVKLDTSPAVFTTGKCPQAALYCGWYSLRNYVDAFDWVPGAVGYHIASFELEKMRDPQFNGWVPGMLRDGITATMGAVEEPYLPSFPPPEEFFTLLLTGRFTLAECYYLTCRYNSWRLVLIGDPLYRPFANNPRISVEQAEKILKQKLLGQSVSTAPVKIILPPPSQ